MKTKLEIIDEIVEYYSTDTSRRGVQLTSFGSETCAYLTNDGKMCAVGRCMIEPTIDLGGAARDVLEDSFYLLKPEYRIEDLEFWENLQNLHDTNSYWDKKGLTQRGLQEIEYLKTRYKD
jgi:hypothetical protein